MLKRKPATRRKRRHTDVASGAFPGGRVAPAQRETNEEAAQRAITRQAYAPIQDLRMFRHGPTDRKARQAAVLGLQRTVGNARIQRALSASLIQREPQPIGKTPAAAAVQTVAQTDGSAWDAIVQAKLEDFLTSFSNIPVTVTWTEDGRQQTTTVHVHPPYFINVTDTSAAASKKRFNRAAKQRKAARGETKKIVSGASWHARHGKSTPQEIQQILQQAVDSGAIPTPDGKKYPDGADLRAWLVRYGIGVDCSGFVSQALNEVMVEVHAQAGESSDNLTPIKKGSVGLKGGASGFTKINRPNELRPGDTMHIPGHIRIIMAVETSEDGYIVFTTAESRSGSKDGVKDIGLDRAVWRYKNPSKFRGLEQQSDNTWKRRKRNPTYGRYDALTKFQEEHVPAEHTRRRSQSGQVRGEQTQNGAVPGAIGGFIETAALFIIRVGVWSQVVIEKLLAALAANATLLADQAAVSKAALEQAVDAGVSDEIKLTDMLFHANHPELGGRRIKSSEEALVNEWKHIRDTQVRPALEQARMQHAQTAA